MNLWSSFSSNSTKEWETKIKKDLKIDSIDSLFWKTNYGLINPISSTQSKLNLNNHSDFKEISWRLNGENCNNKELLFHLNNGINSINIINQSFSESLFENVMSDIIFNNIYLDDNLKDSEISNWLKWINHNESLSGSLRVDIVGSILNDSLLAIKKLNVDFLKSTQKNLINKNFKCLFIDGELYSNLFNDPSVEISHTIAHLNETIETYRNLNIQIPNKLIIKIALSSDFPQEIAKIRALKGLVFQILSSHQLNLDLQIECSFKASELSPLEKENNLLRLTTAFSVAIISGATGIELKDDYTISSGPYWKKIIANIPIILTEESQLNINKDVIEGAHVLEQMSVKMAHQSWDLFKNIENQGGIIQYAKQGNLLKTAKKEQNIKLDNIKSKNKKIIGFNHFTKDGSDLNYRQDLKIPFELKDLL